LHWTQNDGRRGPLQQGTLGLCQDAERLGHGKVPHHDGKGLVRTPLALAQQGHRTRVVRIAGELVPAQPLDGDDLACGEPANGLTHGQVLGRQKHAVRVQERQSGTTDRAGVGLRMKASISRIIVLTLALGTHAETAHRRRRPVVWDRADNGESRSAVRAVGERVPVAPIMRVKELAEAIGAGGNIRRDQLVRIRLVMAAEDLKALAGDDIIHRLNG